ncbi:MAG: protein kinase, partial [bacterium]
MLDLNQKYDSQVIDLLKALGRAYLENGENQKACEKYKQLVNQGIEDPEILVHYALALVRMQAIHHEALQIYRKAVDAEQNNEALYLTLSTLFLRENITNDLSLKVYQRSLKFAPPFEEEIRTALEKIFQETTETMSIPELRQTLLESQESPELLCLYLSTAWREEKYDEALHILKDLYLRTHQNPIYLKAICETLFEKKSRAEEKGLEFKLSSSEVRYFLKYRNIKAPFRRIRDIEFYLDFKNLCAAWLDNSKDTDGNHDEYEFFITDSALEKIEEITNIYAFVGEIEPCFNLVRDFIEKFSCTKVKYSQANKNQLFLHANKNNQLKDSNKFSLVNQCNSIAIFEITNNVSNPENSELPFTTFLELITRDLASRGHSILCRTEDGLITFRTNPKEIVGAAVNILKQLERYNQVVEECEKIELRITIHATFEPLIDSPDQGLNEIRKAFKIHNIDLKGRYGFAMNSGKDFSQANVLLISEPVANFVKESKLKHLGDVRLPHFPDRHPIYEVLSKDTAEKVKIDITTRFGRFVVSETIKENQLYTTFRGSDPQLGRPVIIKAYKARAFSGFKNFTQLRKQFYEEVRRLNRIVHPNVAVVYDAGEQGEILYLVREYVNGKGLNHYFGQQRSPDINYTLELYLQVLKILAHYHQSQIWHKNL